MGEVLELFVAYCGKRKKLNPEFIYELRAAANEFSGDFLAIELEGESKGPAAQLFASMMADGVDPTDQVTVGEWIQRYNDSL